MLTALHRHAIHAARRSLQDELKLDEANRDNFERLTGWVADGSLAPMISQRLPLERAPEALEALAERRAVGKIVLEAR